MATYRVLVRYRDKQTNTDPVSGDTVEIGSGDVKFEIIEGTKAAVEATLLAYMSSKDPKSLMVLGFCYA